MSSFSKLSVTSPTSQLIIQPFPRFTNVTTDSPTLQLLHLRHSSFSNPSFASPTSQDFHLRHLASRPWLLTSQVISVAFYSEREKSDILLKGSNFGLRFFTCRKSTTRYPRLFFPSEGSPNQDFYSLKKSIYPGRL